MEFYIKFGRFSIHIRILSIVKRGSREERINEIFEGDNFLKM